MAKKKGIDPILKSASRAIEGATYIQEAAYLQAQGGMVLSKHHALLPLGGFSSIQNMRPRRPGFQQRKGQIQLHATADSTNRVVNLGMFSKGKKSEVHLYAQMSDGDILEASDLPPTIGAGTFGSEVYSATGTVVPASFATINDRLLIADGTDYPYIYGGTAEFVKRLVVVKSAAALPIIIIDQGQDYTVEVTDDSTSTVAEFDSLSVLTDYDAIFMMTDIPADAFNFTIQNGNTTACASQMHYWGGVGAWTATAGYGDSTELLTLDVAPGTAWVAGQTITGQTSTKTAVIVTVLSTTTYIIRNRSGAFTLGEILEVGAATADQGAAHPQVASMGASGTISFTATTDHIPHYMFGSCGYWYRYSLASGALDADVTCSKVTFESNFAAIQNVWDGAPISCPEAYFYDQSSDTTLFYEGSAINVGAMTSSDILYLGFASPVSAIYLDVSDIGNTVAATATVYYNANGTWTDSSETDGTYSTDATMAKNGWITWARPTTETPMLFQSSSLYQYWYKVVVSATLTADVVIWATGMPYFNMDELGKCFCTTQWKSRAVYAFERTPGYIAISTTNSPCVLNGYDFAFQEIGDGRENKVTAMHKFHSELMVWQEEKGVDGGTTTLIQGHTPDSYGRYLISPRYGTFSQKSAVVIEGVPMPTIFSGDAESGDSTFAFFISRLGIIVSDGRKCKVISGNISTHFDIRETTTCIRRGYETQHWIGYDSSCGVLRVGLVTGASATVPNTFLVYDLATGGWSYDSLAQELGCHVECESGSGALPILQIGGGVDDGLVYMLNYSNNDNGTAITSNIKLELDAMGYPIHAREMFLRTATVAATSIRSASYAWTVSAATGSSGEYYCRTSGLGNPSLSDPTELHINSTPAPRGSIGLLNPGEFAYGDNDSLGYSTIYVRLSDSSDPDSASAGYVGYVYPGISMTPYINNVAQTAKNLSLAPEIASESLRRHRFGVNTEGEHIGIKFENATLNQTFEILDYGLELLVYREW